MPKSITGRNPDSQFPNYLYAMYYIAFSAFSILKIEKFLFIIAPLELMSDYFMLRYTLTIYSPDQLQLLQLDPKAFKFLSKAT